MTRDGTSRSLRRGVVALLAAWMAVFAVIAAVHNHGILGFTARHATLDQSVAGSAQVASCPACLASHVPVPARSAAALSVNFAGRNQQDPSALPVAACPVRAHHHPIVPRTTRLHRFRCLIRSHN